MKAAFSHYEKLDDFPSKLPGEKYLSIFPEIPVHVYFFHISDVCFHGNDDFKDIKRKRVMSLNTHRQLVARHGHYSLFSVVPEFRGYFSVCCHVNPTRQHKYVFMGETSYKLPHSQGFTERGGAIC